LTCYSSISREPAAAILLRASVLQWPGLRTVQIPRIDWRAYVLAKVEAGMEIQQAMPKAPRLPLIPIFADWASAYSDTVAEGHKIGTSSTA